MSAPEREAERWERALHAYHDGELRGVARWRFERRLRRSPGLRRELATLSGVGDLVRAAEAGREAPDLWARLAPRLAAVDAERSEAAERGAHLRGSLFRPLGAVAAAALAAIALAIGLRSGDTGPPGVVQWMDSGGRGVMVLEEASDVTIIWVIEGGSTEGASRGSAGGIV